MAAVELGATISETQLVEWCQTRHPGWKPALARWLDANSSWLHRRCAARLGCAADADDAVQEISIKIMLAVDQFEGRSTLRTWAARIADNHCYSVIQKACTSVLSEHLQYSLILMEQSRYTTPVEVGTGAESAQEIEETLHCLTQQNQQILQLRFYSDQSLDEMATSLSLSLSATKMRLYRALDAFKSIYTKKSAN